MTTYLDARRGRPERWIVGAHRADLDLHLSDIGDPAIGGRHPLPDLQTWCARLGSWGITPTTQVVVYDDRRGGLAAARAWWMLRAVGHDPVEVADLSDLLDRGMALTDVPTPAVDAPPYPASTWSQPTATAEDVERVRHDPRWRLIDARSAVRFRGEAEPFDPVAGHIDGAYNLPWEEAVDTEVAAHRLAEILGDIPPERVIVHCGSGVTACHTLLQMHRLGLDGAALYVGSWSEWCRYRTTGRSSPE